MSDENLPTNVPWWLSLIKWALIVYATGAALTFVFFFAMLAFALNSISQALGLSVIAGVFWPFGIYLWLFP
jgi:hypothetical protein